MLLQLQIAEKAAECVSKSIAALGRQGDDSLMKLILADEQVCGDLLGCLTGLKQRESQDPALRVKALTRVAAAVRSLQIWRRVMVIHIWVQSCRPVCAIGCDMLSILSRQAARRLQPGMQQRCDTKV